MLRPTSQQTKELQSAFLISPGSKLPSLANQCSLLLDSISYKNVDCAVLPMFCYKHHQVHQSSLGERDYKQLIAFNFRCENYAVISSKCTKLWCFETPIDAASMLCTVYPWIVDLLFQLDYNKSLACCPVFLNIQNLTLTFESVGALFILEALHCPQLQKLSFFKNKRNSQTSNLTAQLIRQFHQASHMPLLNTLVLENLCYHLTSQILLGFSSFRFQKPTVFIKSDLLGGLHRQLQHCNPGVISYNELCRDLLPFQRSLVLKQLVSDQIAQTMISGGCKIQLLDDQEWIEFIPA